MPYKTVRVKPAVFMTYKGVKVYHTYRDEDVDSSVSTYSYTLDPETDGDDNINFDIRELDTPNKELINGHPPYLSESNPEYRSADQATRDQWRKDWDLWHSGGEIKAIKAVIRSALQLGLLQLPDNED